MYILNIENVIKMMLKDIREFIFKSYYERISLLKMITIIHRKKQKKNLYYLLLT